MTQRNLRMRRRDELGAVTTEVAIVFPIVLFVMLTLMQAVLWMHASAVAETASAQAAEAASSVTALGVESERGVAAGEAFLIEAGGVANATVAVSVVGENVHVTVRGSAPRLIPGGSWGIEVTVVQPLERYQELTPS